MSFEEYLKEFEPIIKNLARKFNGLHMEYEDRMQEGYLLLFSLIDKLNESDMSIKSKAAYFKKRFEGKLNDINLLEHKQMLGKDVSCHLFDLERDIFETLTPSDVLLDCEDKFLTEYRKRRKASKKKWEATHREQHLAAKKAWRQRNIEKVKEKDKLYYQKNKEKRKEYSKKYYQEHKEEILEKSKKHYQEHKEEIQKRRKK